MRLIATFCLVSVYAAGPLYAQVASHVEPPAPIKGPDAAASNASPSAPFFTPSPRATNGQTSLLPAEGGVKASVPKAQEQPPCLTVQYKCDAKCATDSRSSSGPSRSVVQQQGGNCAANRCHAVGVEQCKETVGKVLIKRQDEPSQKQASAPTKCGLFSNKSLPCPTTR
jgi:hypothetical protein